MQRRPKLSFWNPRQWLRAVMEIQDTPHRIALGSAIGMFIALTPTVGFQMAEVFLVALITRPFFKFNIVAALIAVWVSNPLTTVPIYWFLYLVGSWIVGPTGITFDRFRKLFDYQGWEEWWETLTTLFVDIGWPMLVGTAVVATLGGLLTYPLILWFLKEVHPPFVQETAADEGADASAASQSAENIETGRTRVAPPSLPLKEMGARDMIKPTDG